MIVPAKLNSFAGRFIGGEILRKLGDLFSISSGLVAKRKEAAPGTTGFNYKLLTLRSINALGFIENENLDNFLSIEEIDEKYMAKSGDIIVRLSFPFTAVVIDEQNEGSVITSLFAILKSKNSLIDPQYVSIFLNSELMRKQYAKDASGSAVQMIKTSSIKDYEIAIPNIDKQKSTVKINELMMRELVLLESLIEKKKIYNKMLITKLMEE